MGLTAVSVYLIVSIIYTQIQPLILIIQNEKSMEEKKEIQPKQTNTDKIELLGILILLWTERKKIIYITTAFTIIGILYAFIATPWYEATVKILPSSGSTNRLDQFAGLAAIAGINLSNLNNENSQEIYPEVINSNFVLDRVLKHKFKTATYDYPVTLFEFWKTRIDSNELGWKHKLYEEAKNNLRENYIYTSEEDNGILSVVITTPKDPVLAAEIANYLIEKLDYYNKNFRKYKTKEQIKYIEQSLELVRRTNNFYNKKVIRSSCQLDLK